MNGNAAADQEQMLVQAIVNGDTKRFEEIVQKYTVPISTLVYKLAGTKLDVDDVTQDVLVALYQSLPRFRFGSKLSTYVYRITVNTVAKGLKEQGRLARINDYTESTNPQLHQHSVEETMMHNDRQNELLAAIEQLKLDQRTALTLFYFNELSYKEIAMVMDITLSKTESLLYRAKQNLKNKLDK